MKKILSSILNWIKGNKWKSAIIGVVVLGLVATAITLPIVLTKNDETPASVEPETNPEPEPAPTPVPTYVAVSKEEPVNGTLTLSEVGQVAEGTQITVNASASIGYHIGAILINGETKSTSAEYTFTVSRDIADDQNNIVVSATFEKNVIELLGIAISGPKTLKVAETVTLTATPLPMTASMNDEVTWYVNDGEDFANLSSRTGKSITITGIYEGTISIYARYLEFTSNVLIISIVF